MKTAPRLALCLSLLPGLAWTQAPASRQSSRRPPPVIIIADQCPVEVSRSCFGRCAQNDPTQSCPLAALSCDFKVCWADNIHNARMDTLAAVADPASYVVPVEIRAPANALNAFTTVRITSQGGGELWLIGGHFVQDIFGLETPERARAYIQRAQACSMLAARTQAAFIARSAGSSAMYYVACGNSAVGFREVQPTAAQPASATGGSGAGAGAPSGAGATPAPAAGAVDYDRIHRMSDRELQTMLQNAGFVSINGSRITVSGVNPFAPSTDPDDRDEALADLHQEEIVALKELYNRNVNHALEDAQNSRPAPDGQTYIFNDDTGQAELRPLPPSTPAGSKGAAPPSPKTSSR